MTSALCSAPYSFTHAASVYLMSALAKRVLDSGTHNPGYIPPGPAKPGCGLWEAGVPENSGGRRRRQPGAPGHLRWLGRAEAPNHETPPHTPPSLETHSYSALPQFPSRGKGAVNFDQGTDGTPPSGSHDNRARPPAGRTEREGPSRSPCFFSAGGTERFHTFEEPKRRSRGSTMPSCSPSCTRSHDIDLEDGKWYGVRSYLNLFYEDCTSTAFTVQPEGPPAFCPRHPWPSRCWKLSLSTGTLLLLLGIAALTTGYAVPPKLEAVSEADLPLVDERAADYNKALSTCRLVGTLLCGAAGILLAICLLWVMSGWLSPDIKAEPLETEADSHMEVFRDEPEQQLSPIFHDASGQSWFPTPTNPFGQSSVQTIQPKRDS
ncbi:neurensin-2 [Ctenodactylus gundi]